MARIRTIKPEFFTSEDIVSLSPLSRLFYVSLWCESDREGRLEWKTGTFKMRYFPGDNCDIVAMGQELVAAGLVVLYEANGKKYAEIPTFKEHQVINNREQESVIPSKNDGEDSRVKVACTRDQAEGRKEGKEGKEGKEEPNGSVARADQNPSPQSVVDLFHEVLPELPKVRILDDKRKRSISNFCKWVLTSKRTDGVRRAQTTNEAVDWIRSYFDRARDNDFLMGRGTKAPGHERWECDIDFLLSDKGKKFVIEKTRESA